MTLRSDLLTELEDAITDEAYEGSYGVLSEDQFTRLVNTLASTALAVFEKAHIPADGEQDLAERLVARLLPRAGATVTASDIVRYLDEAGLLRRSEVSALSASQDDHSNGHQRRRSSEAHEANDNGDQQRHAHILADAVEVPKLQGERRGSAAIAPSVMTDKLDAGGDRDQGHSDDGEPQGLTDHIGEDQYGAENAVQYADNQESPGDLRVHVATSHAPTLSGQRSAVDRMSGAEQ